MKKSALLLAAALVASCAGQGDVDRTQPNRLPKSMFNGTWYVRSTVVGVPGTSAAAFVGQTGTMEKIRWDIQENYLIANRAYDEIPGTHSEGPIAAFKIESQFDIKREYNAATGEQTNVISENSSDRPWNERDYIRVDWSKSEIDSQQFYGAGGSVPYSVAYFTQNQQGGADAMRVVGHEGSPIDFDRIDTIKDTPATSWNDRVDYFDMVGRFLLEPEKVSIDTGDGIQDVPLCYFTRYAGANYQTVTCGPAEVEVRTAFLRAGERNFEPMPLPDREMAKFGFFRTERFTYDRRYGFTETGRIKLANVHNLWHATDKSTLDGVHRRSSIHVDILRLLNKAEAEQLKDDASDGEPQALTDALQLIAQATKSLDPLRARDVNTCMKGIDFQAIPEKIEKAKRCVRKLEEATRE